MGEQGLAPGLRVGLKGRQALFVDQLHARAGLFELVEKLIRQTDGLGAIPSISSILDRELHRRLLFSSDRQRRLQKLQLSWFRCLVRLTRQTVLPSVPRRRNAAEG